MAENQNPFETTGMTNKYGAVSTNDLVDGAAYHHEVDYSELYSLKMVEEAGGKITRVRLLTEVMPGRGRLVDVSYVHATLPDGKTVPVQVLMDNLTPMRQVKAGMIKWAKEQGVFAKGIGLLDEGNWSVCY